MSKSRPTYQELEKRLAAAEPIVDALQHHEVDAVVGAEKIAFCFGGTGKHLLFAHAHGIDRRARFAPQQQPGHRLVDNPGSESKDVRQFDFR